MGWVIWIISYLITKDSGVDALALNPWWISLCFLIGSMNVSSN